MKKQLACLVLGTLLLTGCQDIFGTAEKLKKGVNTTIDTGAQKAQEIKETVQQKTTEIQQQYDKTKNSVESKINQINDAGQKIQNAQKALNDASSAVSQITK